MHNKQSTLSAVKYDHNLWDHRERWPRDTPDYVFLARAFQEIGRAGYGNQWTDSYIEPEEPPEGCDDAADEQYDQDCEQAELKFENMHASIACSIAEQSELGNLRTALRHKAGGQMNALEPHFWNAENVGTRFFRCQMSISQPFQDPARVRFEPLYWIYVTRESLDRYIGGDSAEQPAANPQEMVGKSDPLALTRPRTGFDTADEPPLEEMHHLIISGDAKSADDAAGQLAHKAKGSMEESSRQTRLAKKYRKKYPVRAK
jgi:hypothetical protein